MHRQSSTILEWMKFTDIFTTTTNEPSMTFSFVPQTLTKAQHRRDSQCVTWTRSLQLHVLASNMGKWGQLTPLKNRKIKRKHAKESSFLNGGWGWSDTSDDWLVKLMIYIIVIIIAPFCRKIFFTSGGKGALTPLTKILQTPLDSNIMFTPEVSISILEWPQFLHSIDIVGWVTLSIRIAVDLTFKSRQSCTLSCIYYVSKKNSNEIHWIEKTTKHHADHHDQWINSIIQYLKWINDMTGANGLNLNRM